MGQQLRFDTPAVEMYRWQGRVWYRCGRYTSIHYDTPKQAEKAAGQRFPDAKVTFTNTERNPIE